jgi:hypothetical protein
MTESDGARLRRNAGYSEFQAALRPGLAGGAPELHLAPGSNPWEFTDISLFAAAVWNRGWSRPSMVVRVSRPRLEQA